MTYSHTIIDEEMLQHVFDAETILLNKIDSKGYGEYNSIRLFDNKNNEVDLRGLKIIVYKESKNECNRTNTKSI